MDFKNKIILSFNKIKFSSSNFAIAVSGGGDSMALAFLVKKYFPELKFTALIVDHKYRRESTKEANWVKNYLEKSGIKAVVLSPFINSTGLPRLGLKTSPRNDANIKNHTEESLRELRYSLITEYCKKHKIKNVITAHHLEDNIETFLMRLERGSGLQGLSAIKEISEINGIKFIRPLLSFTKDELKKFLIENKIKWVEDPSNDDTKFTRNNIRKTLEGVSDKRLLTKRLSGVIDSIFRANDFIENEVYKYLKNVKKLYPNVFQIDAKKFLNLHEEIQFRILKTLLQNFSDKDIRFENLENIRDKILSQKKFDITYNNAEIIFEENFIYIFPELSKMHLNKKLPEPIGEKGLSELRKNKKVKLPKLNYKILRTLPMDLF